MSTINPSKVVALELKLPNFKNFVNCKNIICLLACLLACLPALPSTHLPFHPSTCPTTHPPALPPTHLPARLVVWYRALWLCL